ncbi:MAG: hypothetical protein HY796_04840 [Elusimicrobia bacterium]|nr:hypothetical protein [Elusimicrobiota bacterium]
MAPNLLAHPPDCLAEADLHPPLQAEQALRLQTKPYTLYPLPSTLYPLPSTLYPLPSTLYPTVTAANPFWTAASK